MDECATGRVSCPPFRQCVNTFGSYICKCHKGFDLTHIAGKYQCHGNEPQPSLCSVSSWDVEALSPAVVTGVRGRGGCWRYVTQKPRATIWWFWMHGCFVSSVYLLVLCGPYKKKFFFRNYIFDAIILLSRINVFFSHFLMQT